MEAAYIKESKARCLSRGQNPRCIPSSQKRLSQTELAKKRNTYREVIAVMDYFGEKTVELLSGLPILIALTDHAGYIIGFFGNEAIKDLLCQVNMQEGTQMLEEDLGTNAVSLAMQEQHPVVLLGQDHFYESMFQTACYSVPFHFDEVDRLSGTVSMMSFTEHHSPFSLPLLTNMVHSMEREIVLRRNSRRTELVHHLIMNRMNDGVMIAEQDGSIIECSPLICRIAGRARSELIGSSVYELDVFAETMRVVLDDHSQIDNRECSFVLQGNKRLICLMDAMPIMSDAVEHVGAYLQLRDITERIELEQQMLTYEKFTAIGKLAAGIAHEIRNPLTSIMGFIKLLRRNEISQESIAPYLEIIDTELQHLSRMVSDFVLMAKPSSPEKRNHRIKKIIQDTVHLMTSQANYNNVIITTELCTPEVKLLIDSMQIKQVLINLIQNAFEAMPKGGQLDIRVSMNEGDSMVLVSIRDYGTGIPEELVHQVFNPFFTTKDNGLGLGLSICYRIVDNHGGTLQVIRPEDGGTEFVIQFPVQ